MTARRRGVCQHVSSRTKKLNPTPELARTPTLHMQSDSGNSKRRISFNPSSGPINVGGLIGRTDSTLAGVLIRTTSAPDVLCCNILEHIVKHDIYVNFWAAEIQPAALRACDYDVTCPTFTIGTYSRSWSLDVAFTFASTTLKEAMR